jgi:sterol desaturase/sphingolipid hydroxylase (fatty acid hydroxylase superfamily)
MLDAIQTDKVVTSVLDYQTLAFFGLVAVFEILERVRPAREIDRWKDLKIDVLSFSLAIVLNQLCKALVAGFVLGYAPAWMAAGLGGLQGLPGVVRIVAAIVVVDFIIYWLHRAQHRFDVLWRTHAWHHSIEQLYWFSGFRTSFFHSFLYAIPVASVSMLVFNLTPVETAIGYSIGLLIQFWEHTNIRANIGPLHWIIITPAYHRVHHSTRHNRSNFGTTFSFWDRMFGTYTDPATVPPDEPLGLGEPIDRRQVPRMLIGV